MQIIHDYSGKYAEVFDRIDKSDYSGISYVLKYVKDGDKVADIACGTGKDLLSVIKNKADIRVIGIDPSYDMISQAIKKFEFYSRKEFFNNKVEDLVFDSTKDVSVAYCLTSFGLIDDADMAIKSAYDMLKPGGKFIFGFWKEDAFNRLYLGRSIHNSEMLNGVYRESMRTVFGNYCITTYVYRLEDDICVTHKVRLYNSNTIKKMLYNYDYELFSGYSKDPIDEMSMYGVAVVTKK